MHRTEDTPHQDWTCGTILRKISCFASSSLVYNLSIPGFHNCRDTPQQCSEWDAGRSRLAELLCNSARVEGDHGWIRVKVEIEVENL